jgi:hypothetical protein
VTKITTAKKTADETRVVEDQLIKCEGTEFNLQYQKKKKKESIQTIPISWMEENHCYTFPNASSFLDNCLHLDSGPPFYYYCNFKVPSNALHIYGEYQDTENNGKEGLFHLLLHPRCISLFSKRNPKN